MRLTVENLSKSYGEKKALDGVTLSFEPGIYGILGPNGAGKSTLMELLTDNITRSGGEICWDGTPVLKMGAQYRKRLGYMPQQQGFAGEMRAREFLHYIGQLKGLGGKKLWQESEKYLELMHLEEAGDQRIGGFSGGMRQRILLAQALLGDPQLLILDEPTAGLDPKERIYIRSLISSLSANKIILFVTHVVSDIESIADRIVLMKSGSVIGQGSPEELIHSVEGQVGECCVEWSDLNRLKIVF